MTNNCTICRRPIVLVPSASERAAKDTAHHPASYFTSLFSEHAARTLDKRRKDTNELMKELRWSSNSYGTWFHPWAGLS